MKFRLRVRGNLISEQAAADVRKKTMPAYSKQEHARFCFFLLLRLRILVRLCGNLIREESRDEEEKKGKRNPFRRFKLR